MTPDSALKWIGRRWLDIVSGVLVVTALLVALTGLSARSPNEGVSRPGRQDVERYELAMLGKRAPQVAVGVEKVDSIDLGASGPRLIVAGENGCAACVYSLPGWSAIAAEFHLREEFIIVSPDSARLVPGTEAPEASELVTRDLATIVRAFGSPAYPVTLTTDQDGIVRFARIGILMSGDVESIRAVLSGIGRP
jgi:hypothetical protein